MANTTKKFQKTRLRKLENLIYFFFAILIFFGIVNVLTYFNLKESIKDFDIISSSYCEYFIFTPSLQNQIENVSIEFSKKDIYVFPDLQNLKCIGKVNVIHILIIFLNQMKYQFNLFLTKSNI